MGSSQVRFRLEVYKLLVPKAGTSFILLNKEIEW